MYMVGRGHPGKFGSLKSTVRNREAVMHWKEEVKEVTRTGMCMDGGGDTPKS